MADPALAYYFALSRQRPLEYDSMVRELDHIRLLETKVRRTQ
jgi:hypothetical protein